MSEKPILFSTDMVRAILDGRKMQTRRLSGLKDVNKNPDIWSFKRVGPLNYKTKKQYQGRFGAYFETEKLEPNTLHICPVVCPYGAPGDSLWVRETWGGAGTIYYKASGDMPDWLAKAGYKWRPSIFMPRWASRITLKIKNIRVERLQDISEEDAIAEGAPLGRVLGYGRIEKQSHKEGFIALWDGINSRRGYPWTLNPWAWVVNFDPCEV